MKSSLGYVALACLAIACSSSSSSTQAPVADAGGDSNMCDKSPAAGYTQIVAASTDQDTDVGEFTAMVLNKAGYPVVAYFVNDSKAIVDTLYTMSWDPCTGTWTTPSKLDTSIQLQDGRSSRNLAMAIDPSDGRIGIAYSRSFLATGESNETIATMVSLSTDDGKTFSPGAQVSINGTGDSTNITTPTIALGGGKTFIAYNQDESACASDGTQCLRSAYLASGGATGAPFTLELLHDGIDALHGGSIISSGRTLGLAVDSAGVPGVVATASYGNGAEKVEFFRPGKTGVLVMDTLNTQNDDGSASLVFDGLNPRALSRINDGKNGNENGNLVFASSGDAGATWSTPILLPLDSQSVDTPYVQVLLADGKGGVVILSQSTDTHDYPLAGPKFWHSSDLKTFTLGSAGPTTGAVPKGEYISGALTAAGKIRMVMHGDLPVMSSSGVLYWSEP